MTGRNQTPRTPLMNDALHVEINRHLLRIAECARLLAPDPDDPLRAAVRTMSSINYARHAALKEEHDLGATDA